MDSNWINYVQNPKSYTVKKWLSELLKEKSVKYDGLSERICVGVTNEDMEKLGKLFAELFEGGYLKAIGEYKSELERLGMKVKVVGKASSS